MQGEKFKPTTDWMQQKYDEFNESLFFGVLGICLFNVAPKGGKCLGRFQLTGDNIYFEKWSRRMYVNDMYMPVKKYVKSENFFETTRPMITLNSNYSATEEAWENTLVHEMCHYYTYKDGYVPKQGHGYEFRQIASSMAIRSNNRFNIKRLADAEEMKNYELDANEQEKKDKRLKNRLSNVYAVIVYRDNGTIEMTITKLLSLVEQIIDCVTKNTSPRGRFTCLKVFTSEELSEILLKYNYKHLQTTYRYYSIEGKPIADELSNLNYYRVVYPEPKESTQLGEVLDKNNTLTNNMMSKEGNVMRISPNFNLGLSSPDENSFNLNEE